MRGHNMSSLNEFHLLVGETIMYCQCIENDVKWIYSGMLEGNHVENFANLEKDKLTLGMVLKQLKKLDNSDCNPYLTEKDYKLLKQITKIRNHLAHNIYLTFVYYEGQERSDTFTRQYRRLINDHNRLYKLRNIIEQVRLDVLRKYGRI